VNVQKYAEAGGEEGGKKKDSVKRGPGDTRGMRTSCKKKKQRRVKTKKAPRKMTNGCNGKYQNRPAKTSWGTNPYHGLKQAPKKERESKKRKGWGVRRTKI